MKNLNNIIKSEPTIYSQGLKYLKNSSKKDSDKLTESNDSKQIPT